MNKIAVAFALLTSLAAPVAASAAPEGPLMVRLRGVYILPADKSAAQSGLPSDVIKVSTKVIPEVDISYFFTPNIAAELILTYPQEHDVKVDTGGIGKIGTATHLPPCLTAQWHFLPGNVVNPYVGLGVNFTLFTDTNLSVGGTKLKLNDYSLGVAGQVGADFKVADRIYVNADVKYVTISSDVKVKATNAKLTSIDINPWLFGVGVGYRFL